MTITRGLTFPEYQALPGVNWSSLKSMAKSPLHYAYDLAATRADTPAMRFGRAVHTAVLEPDRFPLEHVVWDGGDRRGNAWKEFAEIHADRTILKTDEYAACLAVRDAVRSNSQAADLLKGESELSIEWTDTATGIPCKARVDHLYGDLIVDLKTTASIDAHDFEMTAGRMLYHSQLCHYMRGVGTSTPPVIIAVEYDAPYDVAVFELSSDALIAGEQQVDDLMHRLAVCLKNDAWPGRYDGIQPLTVPPWLVVEPDGYGINIGGVKA